MRRPLATASVSSNGQPVARLPVFVVWLFILWLFWPAGRVSAEMQHDAHTLNELAQLARAGAPQLALKRMDAEQPGSNQDPVAWMAWEQERLQILAGQQLYVELIRRVDDLPADTDRAFQRQALTLKAEAQLQLEDGEGALATLRELLWSEPAEQRREIRSHWRQLVIRSYLLGDRYDDARIALQRYRQDYGDASPQWRWLSAQVMLLSGDAAGALQLLENDTTPRGRLLYLVARLAQEPGHAADIATAAATLAAQSETPGIQQAAWALAAASASKAGDTENTIRYLERALSLSADPQLARGLLDVDADQLWDAYLARGKRIGNDEQKLLGNDEDWYFPATEALENDPLRARVLFAVLAEYGTREQRRSVAHEYLVSLLKEEPRGDRVIQQLYLESDRFREVDRLPPVIRYQLIDEALENGDLQTASRLMADLPPPAGSDRFDWELRRARVAVFTGRVDAGASALERLLAAEDQDWSPQRVDRLLQVVFDLQTVQAHDQALNLFDALLGKSLEPQQHRELLFWMADSLEALDRYDESAYLYLKSATLHDPTAMDPWAQTARYRAAKVLVEGGLLADARQIYTGLLRSTPDESRRAMLQNELQRLHLMSRSQSAGGQ